MTERLVEPDTRAHRTHAYRRGDAMYSITPAAPADIPAAADVLAEAFQRDTVMTSLLAPSGSPVERLATMFRALLRSGPFRSRRVDLARRADDGAVVGAAIWEPPQHHATLLAQALELPAFVRALGWRGILAAARLQSRLNVHRPAEPHWYLAQIGVSPRARGAGLGSALLRARLDQIDAANMPAYLESSNERNRALYRRNGFGDIQTVTGLPNGGPMAMWRPARPLTVG